MSAIIETFIQCDGCSIMHAGTVDCRCMKAWEHRRDIKADGWRYINGKDYCDECIETGKHK